MSYIGTEPKDIRSFGRTQFDYTATQGQTAFTGADDDGKVLAFTVGQIEVYVNGILMDDSDFTTTGTGTVTLASAANLNDVINIVSFESNIPDNDYVPASGGTFTGAVTHSGAVTNSSTTTMTGDLTVDTNTLHVDAADNRVGIGTTSPDRIFTINNGGPAVEIDPAGQSSNPIYFNYNRSTSAYLTPEYWALGHKFMRNGGSTALEIDSSGRVTKPSQPAFCAQGSPSVTSDVIHSYGSVLFNTGSHYNNSTGKFTAPVDGKYFFTCTIWPSGTMDANNTYLAFYQNDSTERTGSHGSTNRQGITISSVLSMSANDTMLVKILGSWSRQGSFPRNNFSGFLVG